MHSKQNSSENHRLQTRETQEIPGKTRFFCLTRLHELPPGDLQKGTDRLQKHVPGKNAQHFPFHAYELQRKLTGQLTPPCPRKPDLKKAKTRWKKAKTDREIHWNKARKKTDSISPFGQQKCRGMGGVGPPGMLRHVVAFNCEREREREREKERDLGKNVRVRAQGAAQKGAPSEQTALGAMRLGSLWPKPNTRNKTVQNKEGTNPPRSRRFPWPSLGRGAGEIPMAHFGEITYSGF